MRVPSALRRRPDKPAPGGSRPAARRSGWPEAGWTVLRLVAALVLAAPPARAGYFDRIEIGARGLALASAYGAGVQDVSSLYWNPAALGTLSRREVLLTHSRPYFVGSLASNSVVAGLPLASGGAAVGWHHLGLAGVVGEDLLMAGYGRWIYRDDRRTLLAGATAELAVVSFADDASSHDLGRQTRFTSDLGLLLMEGPNLRLGAVWRHLGEPEFDFVPGGASTPIPGGLELSLSYHWRPESTIYLARSDIDGEVAWNYAGEIWFYDVFAIRAGIFDEEFAGGFGLKGKQWELDIAFLTHESLGNTYRASLLLFPFGGGER